MNMIIQALEQHARQTPSHIAIEDGQRRFDWRTLHQASSALARHLRNRGLAALLLDNGPAWAAADLACLHAQTACLPLPAFFSDPQLQHCMSDAGADTLLTDAPERLSSWLSGWKMRRIEVLAQRLFLFTRPERRATADFAKLTYTSGSTGQPRGVPLGRQRLEDTALALLHASGGHRDDRALASLPLSTLLENLSAVHVPVLAGATLLLPAPGNLGFQGSRLIDPQRYAAALAQLQPSTAVLTPELLKLFLQLASADRLPASFRFIAVGGAPVSAALLNQAQELGLPVYQGYGLSEAGSVVCLNRPGDNQPGSVGRPLPGFTLRIAEDGEVLIGNSGFGGYLHQPRASDPWLASGDLGELDEQGRLYIHGRKKNLIIDSFGRNISPEWIEAELLGNPVLQLAIVHGEGQPRLSALLLPAPGIEPEAVHAWLRQVNERLPDYARIHNPVVLEQLPPQAMGGSGKPRRDWLINHYRQNLNPSGELQQHVS